MLNSFCVNLLCPIKRKYFLIELTLFFFLDTFFFSWNTLSFFLKNYKNITRMRAVKIYFIFNYLKSTVCEVRAGKYLIQNDLFILQEDGKECVFCVYFFVCESYCVCVCEWVCVCVSVWGDLQYWEFSPTLAVYESTSPFWAPTKSHLLAWLLSYFFHCFWYTVQITQINCLIVPFN